MLSIIPCRITRDNKDYVNRGVRGYQTGLLLDNLDAHLYGDAVDQIVLLIGTNDIGKDVPMSQALTNLESVIQSISRDYPLSQIKLVFYSASSSRGRIQTEQFIFAQIEKNQGLEPSLSRASFCIHAGRICICL